MRLAVVGAWLALGCGSLFGDLDRVIALEIIGAASDTVGVGESLQLLARPVTAGGDSVPGGSTEVVWAVLDTGVVAFTLEPDGLVRGLAAGTGRVQAQYQELRSDPIRITVIAAP